MIDFKNKQSSALSDAIAAAGHTLYQLDGALVCSNEVAVQAIIDAFVEPMPDLSKRQFNRFLAHTGLDDAIAARLAVLKPISRAQYADLKVWFNDAVCPIKYDTVYNKIQAIKNDLPVQVPPLVLTANALKSAWNSAASITGGD